MLRLALLATTASLLALGPVAAQAISEAELDAAVEFVNADEISDEAYHYGWCASALTVSAEQARADDPDSAAGMDAAAATLFAQAEVEMADSGFTQEQLGELGTALATIAYAQVIEESMEADYAPEECLELLEDLPTAE